MRARSCFAVMLLAACAAGAGPAAADPSEEAVKKCLDSVENWRRTCEARRGGSCTEAAIQLRAEFCSTTRSLESEARRQLEKLREQSGPPRR